MTSKSYRKRSALRLPKTEFGDFQTPLPLAARICQVPELCRLRPAAIIEPTCGLGNLLITALRNYPSVRQARGLDVNADYVGLATTRLQEQGLDQKAVVQQGDFFTTDWRQLIEQLPEPLLVIGNPPWVTNSELGLLRSTNLPDKSNSQGRSGLDALTGKSNFDISESMLRRFLEWLNGRRATLAMLCKTTVARKIMAHAWQHGCDVTRASIYRIDASEHFGASVAACLLVCHMGGRQPSQSECSVWDGLDAKRAAGRFGYRHGCLVADLESYERGQHLQGPDGSYRWRSGVKHDCAKIMELRRETGGRFRNGLGELVELERDYLFPLLKSSDVANRRTQGSDRWMLVTQQAVGDDTADIKRTAPQTWRYLQAHADRLDRRASSIYRQRPRFSVFGVGRYTFSPHKVAISGFYKRLDFVYVGSSGKKPTVLDDTCYFIACQSQAEAKLLVRMLNSEVAKEFYNSLAFWDSKRPITVDLLGRLSIRALAEELKLGNRLRPANEARP